MLGVNVNNRSSSLLIAVHYATASICFFAVSILIFFSVNDFLGHFFNPHLLSITHLIVIGWGVMMIMGALYQLLPVIVNNKLHSTRLGIISYLFIVIGVVVLSLSFWMFSVGSFIQIAGSLLLSGILLFFVNVYRTAAPQKKLIEYDFILSSILWLLVTCIIGVLMAFNFEYVFLPSEHLHYLKLHAHVGVFGFFILLIIGVSSKLIPMFLLSQNVNNTFLTYSFYLINVGLLLMLIDGFVFLSTKRILFYSLIVFLGVILYLFYIRSVFKNRVRKILDIPMKKSMLSFLFLIIMLLLYISAALYPDSELKLRLTITAGVFFFMGFVSLLIFGQTFKTLPFIIWLDRFKDVKERKILPKDLYSEYLLQIQFSVFIVGFLFFVLGILLANSFFLYSGASSFVITALLYCINVFKVIVYKSVY